MATQEKAGPMTRDDIVGAVAAKLDVSTAQAKSMTQEYEAAIARALSAGQEVRLNGFAIFKLQHREARMTRNPRTGDPVQSEAKTVVKFQPAKALKDSVVEGNDKPAKAAPASKAKAAPAAKAKAAPAAKAKAAPAAKAPAKAAAAKGGKKSK